MNKPITLKYLLPLLFTTLFLFTGCDSSARVQGEMMTHLNQAYGMPFVVEMPDFQGVNGMWPGIYTANAWPKDKPSERFNVFWSTGEPPESITDNYLSMKWTRALRNDADPKLKEQLGNKLVISTFTLDLFSPEKIRKSPSLYKDLSLAQLLSADGKDLQVTLRLIVPTTGSVDPVLESHRLQTAFETLIRDSGIGHYSIEVVYVPPESVQIYEGYTLTPPRDTLDRLHRQNILLNFMALGTDTKGVIPWTDEASIQKSFLY